VKLRRLARRRARRLALIAVGLATLAPAGPAAATYEHSGQDDDDSPGKADLTLSISASDPVVQAGDTARFTARIANVGPRDATRVRVVIALTGRIPVQRVSAPDWWCVTSVAVTSCTLQRLKRGADSSIVVSAVAPLGFMRIGAGAAVTTSKTRDPKPSNNSGTTESSINNPPVVTADVGATFEGDPVEVPVLENDFDPDADPFHYDGVTQPAGGSVTCHIFGCTYSPSPGFVGDDSFTYSLADDRGGHGTAEVKVKVHPKPKPPQPPPAVPPVVAPPTGGAGSSPGAVVSGPTAVAPGQTAGYTTIISNRCSVRAENVVVRLILPPGAVVLSAPSRSTRRGRVLLVPVGTLLADRPRGVGVRLRFGKNGGSLRTLVASVHTSNGPLTGDGLVINVR
jgi:uncharacterized repeat protein (TIGR01451 family)